MRSTHGITAALAPLALLAAALVLLGGAVAAHTAVQSAEPAPGEVVSGTVDRVELVFLDPVADAEIDVAGPSGQTLTAAGDTQLSDDGTVVTLPLPPLRVEGTYQVDYRYVAQDGAAQSGSYQFRYEAAAAGGGVTALLGVVAALVALALLAAVVIALRRRARS